MSQYCHKVSQKSPTLCPGYYHISHIFLINLAIQLTIYTGAGKYFPWSTPDGAALKY